MAMAMDTHLSTVDNSYEGLKKERNRLKALLDSCSDMKGRHSYNMVRKKYDEQCVKIKALFHTE